MRSNKVEYNTSAGMYCTIHDVKVNFGMPEFSSSNIINHCFHVKNYIVKSGIGYDMIIGRDLMVQLGLMDEFKCKDFQCNGATVHMKEPSGLLGKSDLTKREMCELVMQTTEPASTREATERIVKILNSTYVKADLKQVSDNSTQLNAEEINQLLSLPKDFEDLFGVTLGDWATEPVDLELKPGSKPFNSRYYPVPRIDKETFRKYLK